jgi:hypothetical protein
MHPKFIIFLVPIFSLFVVALPVHAGITDDAEPTPLETWRPVESGMWVVRDVSFAGGTRTALAEKTASACPYPSLFFLRSFAPVKIGKAGCQFETYRISDQAYHITGTCKNLRGGNHLEMTTLTVASDRLSFKSATSWTEQNGKVTLRREGRRTSACRAD